MSVAQVQPSISAPASANAAASLPVFLREKQLRTQFINISHGALWSWVASGAFPPPIRLSAGVTAWRRSDLEDWANGQWKSIGQIADTQ